MVILSGALPPGLQLSQVDDHTALVSGVPTEQGTWTVWLAASTGAIAGKPKGVGTFRFTVRVRDALGTASTKAFVLGVG